MGPLPKRRHSHSRTHKRRAHDALSLKHLVKCETCGNYHVVHHICPNCGSYKGEQIIDVDDNRAR